MTSQEYEDEQAELAAASSGLVLRTYQKEAVERAFAAKRSTVKAPTGTGKTMIAIKWLEKVAKNALIIVPTQALIYQSWTPKLLEYGYENVGHYYAFAKNFGNPITVTTFSSAVMRPAKLLDRVDVVVVDEIHHLGAQAALRRLLPKLKDKEFVLGLSSVPEREDNLHELFLQEFPICYDLGLGEAIRSGYVSPLRVLNVPAEMTDEERQAYDSMTLKIKRAFRVCGPNIRRWGENYFSGNKGKLFIARQGMWALVKRKQLLSDIASKREQVLKIIQAHPEERVILFSESVSAIEHIRAYLGENGIPCETFHSGRDPSRRQQILSEWGEQFQVLLSCRALEEGIDVKEVAIGVLITNGKSKRQFIQRIGRIIRPMEGKNEARFYVVYSPDTSEESYYKTVVKILNGR